MQVHRMHPQSPPHPAEPAEAAGAHPAGREGRLDLESIREKSLLRGETIRERMEWIESRRRELRERMDQLQARLGGSAPSAAASSDGPAVDPAAVPDSPPPGSPGAPAPLAHSGAPARGEDGPAGRSWPEPSRLVREVRGSEVRLEQVRPQDEAERKAERRWLRDQVTAMRRAGWSWEELAGIGFGRALLADLGFEFPAGGASRVE